MNYFLLRLRFLITRSKVRLHVKRTEFSDSRIIIYILLQYIYFVIQILANVIRNK